MKSKLISANEEKHEISALSTAITIEMTESSTISNDTYESKSQGDQSPQKQTEKLDDADFFSLRTAEEAHSYEKVYLYDFEAVQLQNHYTTDDEMM